MRQRQVADGRAIGGEEQIERPRLLAGDGLGPQFGIGAVVVQGEGADHFAKARSRYHPFDRAAAIARGDCIADLPFLVIERREMDVRAFGFEHGDAPVQPLQHGDAEAGARPDHRNRALFRQQCIRAAEMREMLLPQRMHGMGHRAEIVEQE